MSTDSLPDFLSGLNAAYLEELYAEYANSDGPNADWAAWFSALKGDASEADHRAIREQLRRKAQAPLHHSATGGAAFEKQAAALRLINAYRFRGHQAADLDPLKLEPRPPVTELDPGHHGLVAADMDTVLHTGSLVAPESLPLSEIMDLLQEVYTGRIGSEYMHITDTEQKRWIQQRLEGTRVRPGLDASGKRHLLKRLVAAEGIERYLHRRYTGQKRFSLEGSETLIPALDELIQRAGSGETREIVIGMAHRGRLNVLVNVLGKPPRILFDEFEDKGTDTNVLGDVKYHLGYSADIDTPGGAVHVVLAFNPSHLEAVDPVVEGSVCARQKRRGDATGRQVLPVLIHGDAALSGQGVVMETLNMSQARGYRTGGTVHLVVNNQIGFTMSNPVDARSSVYCTEVAKMVQAPIFHVNGDDPEAVIFVTRLALDFRTRFARDVVVDVVSYRRHGHNEADEPAVTQPIMYRKIRQMPTVMELYTRKLVSEGVATPDAVEEYKERYRVSLEDQGVVAENFVDDVSNEFSVDWSPYWGTDWTTHAKTAVGKRQLRPLAEKLNQVPKGFELHPRVKRILDDRKKMAAGAMAADWGFAETMAYATLLVEGHGVRLTGQDSGRGTFFHRHAVLHNQKNGDTHVPLRHLGSSQADFTVIDSLLSEEAALGFEYGYATAEPTTLVVWEAQFGDFANGAQVMVDQFITSGQEKWNRLCHLVMMLPHGYEGAGPEHSSARLERYLQLSAGHNIQVCVPTTPAQMFHLLRRQVVRPFRRPLVIMSPKSLLRFKPSMSSLDQLARGRFYNAIGETADLDPERVRRIVLCSGKVFYDLDAERAARGLEDVALVRIEQLYPFPKKAVLRAMAPFINATRVVWCQEEPRNQGAWYQSQHHLRGILRPGQTLGVSSRPLSASPASGYYRVHVAMQKSLVWNALGIKQGLSVVPRADGELKQA